MADPLSFRNTTRNRSVFGRRIGTRPPNKAEVMQDTDHPSLSPSLTSVYHLTATAQTQTLV